MSEWIQKPWGRTRPLSIDDSLHVWECEAVAGGFCSIHKHRHKRNIFVVIDGDLVVEFFGPASFAKLYAQLPDKTTNAIVEAGELHRFVARERSRFLEIYLPAGGPLSADDIERFLNGGVKHE